MPADTVPPSAPSRWVAWTLAALLAASFALRAWDASHGLGYSRSFDERFTLRNVSGLLRHCELRPSHAFYLGLSYYPQTAVLAASQQAYRWTGWQPLAIFGGAAGSELYTPTAFFLCRLVNVVFGVLSLYVVFLIGRRLHSPGLGLLAAAILAAFHRHVVSSTHFKPDILVMLLTALALLWAIDAAIAPGPGRFLRAGLAIGLAVGTKYTGVAAALPIAAAVPLFGGRDRKQWLWLIGAGLASVATFVAINPYLGVVFRFIPKIFFGYAAHGTHERSNHWVVLRRELAFLGEQHGPAVALFLVLGVGWLLWRLLRRGDPMARTERIGWSLTLALLLGYTVLHAAGMTLFRVQNFLPVVPASSLVAAWAMVELWRAARARWVWLGTRPVAIGLWSVVGALLLVQQFASVYGRVIPTNWELANRGLMRGFDPPHERHVVCERALGPFSAFGDPRRPLVTQPASLARVGEELLDGADAEAFPARRLDGPDGAFYRRRMARLPEAAVEVVRSRPLRSRGDAIVVLHHPWRKSGEPLPLELAAAPDGHGLSAPLPAVAAGERVSLLLWIPARAAKQRARSAQLVPSATRLPLGDTGRRLARHFRLSPRCVVPAGDTRLELTRVQNLRSQQILPRAAATDLRGWGLQLLRWQEPAGTGTPP